MLEIDQRELDTTYFYSIPPHTVDLKLETIEFTVQNDHITKETLVDPDDKNIEIWLDALDTFFVGDKSLIAYVQRGWTSL